MSTEINGEDTANFEKPTEVNETIEPTTPVSATPESATPVSATPVSATQESQNLDNISSTPPIPKDSGAICATVTDPTLTDTPPLKPEEDVRVRNLRLIARAKEKLQRENIQLQKERNEALAKLKEYNTSIDDSRVDDSSVDDTGVDEEFNAKSRSEISELKKQVLLQQQQQQQFLTYLAVQKAEEKLLSQYNDFADVVSDTNVTILKELDPEITKQIIEEPDVFKKGIKAYTAIRKHKIFQSANNNDAIYNKEIISKNLTKPKTASGTVKSAADSASVFANLHSRDFQNQLRKELEESKRRM